jgi:uncharacterized membrane protein YkvI
MAKDGTKSVGKELFEFIFMFGGMAIFALILATAM